MNIKSLVNNEVVNITNCESEPIHIPGSIQTHGFLIAIKSGDDKVTYASKNCEVHFHLPLIEILGKSLSLFFNKDELTAFTAYYQLADNEMGRPFVFSLQGRLYNTIAYQSGQNIVLEMEPFTEEHTQLPDLYIQTKRFAYHTERADNLKNLCRDIANETKLITGYHRVMIYRFDKDYNGEVYAESKEDELEPFLGLHYPHTDIPAQARELYMLNHVRMIADVAFEPVPLFTLEEEGINTNTLDLSFSFLRSVSPIHIQYLKNMGVAAAFSISLIHNKKLWGLISCHHYTPKYIPYHTRLAAHLQAIFLQSQIDVRQVADEFELTKQTDKKLDDLNGQLSKQGSIIGNDAAMELVKNLLHADGLAVLYNGNFYTAGIVPAQNDITLLANWLFKNTDKEIFSTSRLADYYLPAKEMSNTVAGLCYLQLGAAPGNGIFWMRQEIQTTIHWGGDPAKAILLNEENKLLTPRKSFAAWGQSVKYQSDEWRRPELNAAGAICTVIQRQLHLADLKEEEIKYRSLNEKLQKANDELANMNWISTHDLKEPLRKIQMYASVVLEKYSSEIPDIAKSNIVRMQASAAKMQRLIEALVSYASLMYEDAKLEQVDLNAIMKEVMLELKENLEETGAVIEVGVLPTVNGIAFQLQQLFINIISNALKFSKEHVPAVIKISCTRVSAAPGTITTQAVKAGYKISFADNGIGFKAAFKNDIFKVFHRLHTNQYHGSGIGLAICKKIAEANGGYIEAESIEGEGATFTVFLADQV
jgi:two-component system, chemotaxis family, sensor kinase Cph1